MADCGIKFVEKCADMTLAFFDYGEEGVICGYLAVKGGFELVRLGQRNSAWIGG